MVDNKYNELEIPEFIYGTAWKKTETTKLVELALDCGFRAIDTANQLKHYDEAAVGVALAHWFEADHKREDLWIQSKWTSTNGQDHRLPYDPNSSFTEQVVASFKSSLEHLHTTYLDSYLIHGPMNHPGLGQDDFEVWRALENLYNAGQVKRIGISNVNYEQLSELLEKSTVKPTMVQNRCYANKTWDKKTRQLCQDNQIHYQGFSLLTANRQVLEDGLIKKFATYYQKTPNQIVFRFSQQTGMIPLTGTSSKNHMLEDLSSDTFELTEAELQEIEHNF